MRTRFYSPGNGEDIVVPPGFKVSVFAKDLNFPVGIAFTGNDRKFSVYVLESGHGLPSICNDEDSPVVGGTFSPTNPFTPDILVFDQDGNKIAGPLAKPTPGGAGLLPHGPAVGIGFEKGFKGGRLFVTDSNQAIRQVGGQNNSSRIVIVDTEDRCGHSVHHRAPDRRPPLGAARVQGRVGVLVAGIDDQLRRRRP